MLPKAEAWFHGVCMCLGSTAIGHLCGNMLVRWF